MQALYADGLSKLYPGSAAARLWRATRRSALCSIPPMPLYFAHTTADHRHALFRIVHAATRMTCFHAGSTDGRCVARTFSRSGCCEVEGSACVESGSKGGADHSIDWGLVKGRISTTGTCYVKASTDEMTPYITIPEDPYVFHAARASDGGHSFSVPPPPSASSYTHSTHKHHQQHCHTHARAHTLDHSARQQSALAALPALHCHLAPNARPCILAGAADGTDTLR